MRPALQKVLLDSAVQGDRSLTVGFCCSSQTGRRDTLPFSASFPVCQLPCLVTRHSPAPQREGRNSQKEKNKILMKVEKAAACDRSGAGAGRPRGGRAGSLPASRVLLRSAVTSAHGGPPGRHEFLSTERQPRIFSFLWLLFSPSPSWHMPSVIQFKPAL